MQATATSPYRVPKCVGAKGVLGTSSHWSSMPMAAVTHAVTHWPARYDFLLASYSQQNSNSLQQQKRRTMLQDIYTELLSLQDTAKNMRNKPKITSHRWKLLIGLCISLCTTMLHYTVHREYSLLSPETNYCIYIVYCMGGIEKQEDHIY